MPMKQMPPQLGLLDGIPTHEILEGLARIHQHVLVADSEGHIVWMSDALGVICGGAPGDDVRHLCSQLPHQADQEQLASLRNDLKMRDAFADGVFELARALHAFRRMEAAREVGE